MKIAKIINPENLSFKILKEENVLTDYLDWDSIQSFDEFKSTHKISFSSNDFCLLASDDIFNQLKKRGIISIFDFKSFGWYDRKINLSKWTTFELEGLSSSDLEEKNSSFNQYRNTVRSASIIDSIKGGLILSSRYHKDEWESFLGKLDFKSSDGSLKIRERWYIDLSKLSQKELQVCNQMLFLNNFKGVNNIGNSIYKTTSELLTDFIIHENDEFKERFRSFNELAELVIEYLIDKPNFNKNEFLEFLIKSKDSISSINFKNQLEFLYKEIIEQVDTKKITYLPLKSLKAILAVCDSEIVDVKNELSQFKGVELFILGLIRRGSNLEKHFESTLVSSIYQLLTYYILDIQPRAEQNKILKITLDSVAIERNPHISQNIFLGLEIIQLYQNQNNLLCEYSEELTEVIKTKEKIELEIESYKTELIEKENRIAKYLKDLKSLDNHLKMLSNDLEDKRLKLDFSDEEMDSKTKKDSSKTSKKMSSKKNGLNSNVKDSSEITKRKSSINEIKNTQKTNSKDLESKTEELEKMAKEIF